MTMPVAVPPQSAPLPFFPPIESEQIEPYNLEVAQHLTELSIEAEKVMCKAVIGFFERPEDERMAFYVMHEPLLDFFILPQPIASAMPPVPDPVTGMPPPPMMASLVSLIPIYCADMMNDAASLYKKAGKQFSAAASQDAMMPANDAELGTVRGDGEAAGASVSL